MYIISPFGVIVKQNINRRYIFMSEERKEIIAELNKEIEEISNISVIRFILSIVRSYKKGGVSA